MPAGVGYGPAVPVGQDGKPLSSKQRRLLRELMRRWTGVAKKEEAGRVVPVAAADRGRKRIPMGKMTP